MKRAGLLLLLLGLLQMAGDVAGVAPLRAVGAATSASPAPRVFSAVRGFETYSTRFFLEWTDDAGREHSLALTPEVYARLRGPYNRRNAYGAIVAYGPVLASDPATRPLFDEVAAFALCGEAPLLRELGVDAERVAGHARLRLEPLPGSDLGELPLVLEPTCAS